MSNYTIEEIFKLITNGEIQTIREIIESGYDINNKDHLDQTMLMIAIREQREGIALELIKLGIDLDSKDAVDNTPLILASMKQQERVVKKLIEKKVDLEEVNILNQNALMVAIQKESEEIIHMLVEAGSNFFYKRNEMESPLSYAINSKLKPAINVFAKYQDKIPKKYAKELQKAKFKILFDK